MSRRLGLYLAACVLPVVAFSLDSSAEGALAPIARSVWLHSPDAAAVPAVESLLDRVLDNVVTENRLRMTDSDVQVHIIPWNKRLTDLPPWAFLRNQPIAEDPHPPRRTYDDARGLGPTSCSDGPLHIAIAEEQMMTLPEAPYPSPSPGELGKNLVHEVGHAIECSLTPVQRAALEQGYSAAVARSPRGIVGAYPAYTLSTTREYFAEGVVAWFEAADSGNYRRAWLASNDRLLYELLQRIFTVPPPLVTCAGERATTVLTADHPIFAGTAGREVVAGSPVTDVINAGSGDDVICGGDGNDHLYGGFDDDRIEGGPGDDTSSGGLGDDHLLDGVGLDSLAGGGGEDVLDARDEGEPAADRLDASSSTAVTCLHDPDDELVGCPSAGSEAQ